MTPAAASLHERLVDGATAVSLAILPLAATLFHRGLAPILLVIGLSVATLPAVWRAGVSHFLTPPFARTALQAAALAFLALICWTSLSGLWSPIDGAEGLGLQLLAPLLAAGAAVWRAGALSIAAALRLSRIAAAAGVATLALLAFEAATGGLLRTMTPPVDLSPDRWRDMVAIGRGATAAALMSPAILTLVWALTKSRSLVAMAGLAALFAAGALSIFTNVVILVASALAFGVARWRPRLALGGVAALMLAALALAPLAALIPADALTAAMDGRAPASWLQRLTVWRAAATEALACLPFGCGADYARAIHAQGETFFFPSALIPLSVMPLHPHNAFLQMWLELGVVGVGLLFFSIAAGARAAQAAKPSPLIAAAIAATAAGVFVSALVEMSIWQMWRHAAVGLAAAFIAFAARRCGDDPHGRDRSPIDNQ